MNYWQFTVYWRRLIICLLFAVSACFIVLILVPEVISNLKTAIGLEKIDVSKFRHGMYLYWNLAIILIFLYLLPEFGDILRNISKLQFGSFSLELRKTTIRSHKNVNYIYGSLFVNQNKWDQAADMFLAMRSAPNMEEKISGWLASAELLVQLFDAKKTLNGEEASDSVKVDYLRKAQNFCDHALYGASTLDSESKEKETAAAYHQRAIVRSRLFDCEGGRTTVEDVFGDLRNAVELDSYYLRYATFDTRLSLLMEDMGLSDIPYKRVDNRKQLEEAFLKSVP